VFYHRSGKYVYKPTMNMTCCPQYPIRCDVANLRLTKSQKKVIKRVNRYLSYGECQEVTSSEPERHGREEAAPAAAAAGCRVMKDDVKLQGALSSPRSASGSADAVPSGSQSTVTVSSPGSEKKVTHRTPKPGAYWLSSCYDEKKDHFF